MQLRWLGEFLDHELHCPLRQKTKRKHRHSYSHGGTAADTDTYTCVCIYIYIYIYTYREREREREMYVDMHICMYLRACVRISLCMSRFHYVSTQVFTYVSTRCIYGYVHVCVCMFVWVLLLYVCVNVCMYACTYACMHVCMLCMYITGLQLGRSGMMRPSCNGRGRFHRG